MNSQPTAAETMRTVAPDAMSSMFQAIAGLRNMRAAMAMLGCFVAAWIVMALAGAASRGSVGVGLLAGLVALIVSFSGIHASGVLLMEQARGLPARSIKDAVLYGLMCVPKTIVLIIALVIAAIAVHLLIAMVFWVSKMPAIGPLLFAAAFPLSVVLAGAVFIALGLGVLLSLAAIWNGATIGRALAQTLTILRHRLVETMLLSVVVFVLAFIVGGIVTSILLTGLWPAAGIALGVLDVSVNNLSGLTSIFTGHSSFGGGGRSGHALAGIFGFGVLWAMATTLLMQVGLMGINLVYLRVSEGIDASEAESKLAAGLDSARRKAAEVGQKAKVAADNARAKAEQMSAQGRPSTVADPPPTAPVPSASTCPKCQTPTLADDAFCGSCGHKLA